MRSSPSMPKGNHKKWVQELSKTHSIHKVQQEFLDRVCNQLMCHSRATCKTNYIAKLKRIWITHLSGGIKTQEEITFSRKHFSKALMILTMSMGDQGTSKREIETTSMIRKRSRSKSDNSQKKKTWYSNLTKISRKARKPK